VGASPVIHLNPGPSGPVADEAVDHKFHVHLVSDSTGETLHAMTNAALAQFENVEVMVHPYALVRAEQQLTRALDHIAILPGIVFFTLANQNLRNKLITRCKDIEVRCIDLLEGPVTALAHFLGREETHRVGRQHEVDQRYLERIEAMNFTIAHDDGQSLDSIGDAEIILTGASRTSKTPTCVYLAIRGIRAANVPLVPGVPPPSQLLQARKPLIVGLWVSPDRLVQVRRNRLSSMGETRDSSYVELDAVRAEVAATRQLFENQDWPMIDVSRRSIEETAASVINMMTERKEALA